MKNKSLKNWDLCCSERKIPKVEKTAILRIPLSSSDGPDRLVWPYKEKGELTAKSTYAFLKEKEQCHENFKLSSSQRIEPALWKQLWKIEC